MSNTDQRLTAIAGQPPDLAALPSGCAFAQRCPQAFSRCRDETPPAFYPEQSHVARCWLVDASAERRVPAEAV